MRPTWFRAGQILGADLNTKGSLHLVTTFYRGSANGHLAKAIKAEITPGAFERKTFLFIAEPEFEP